MEELERWVTLLPPTLLNSFVEIEKPPDFRRLFI